jgi:hypothetical protein
MNSMHTTPSTWFERGSLLLASTALLGSLASADPKGSEAETPKLTEADLAAPALQEEAAVPAELGFKDALKGGKWWLNLRYRIEAVEQANPLGLPGPITKDAFASTLRTRLGYETADYKNFSGLLEFSDVAGVPGGTTNYNDTLNGKAEYPVVADPTVTVVNQVYGKYDGFWDSDIKVGRQSIVLDNSRFVGNVIWRQTEQTFDSASFVKPDLATMNLTYAYIANVNRIFGANSTVGDVRSNNHIVNLSKDWENFGKLVGYGYYLDMPQLASLSSMTYGLRFNGKHNFDKFGLLYTAEYAQQSDVGDNTNDVDAGYLHAMLGGSLSGFVLKLGHEVLEGANNIGGQFQTPLATAHAFNGWADKFLSTPLGGLEDTYFSLGYNFDKTKLVAIYHDFSAERGPVGSYGTEIDLQATHKFSSGIDLGLKYADYSADNFTTDTTKYWLWLGYSF